MSKVQEIIDRLEARADRNISFNNYSQAIAYLEALDILVDELAGIQSKLEEIRREMN